MTPDDIADTLPNGFHDASIHSFAFDLVARVVTFRLDVWLGDANVPGYLEMYRPARLALHGVAYLAVQPPDARYDYAKPRPIRVDLCDPDPTTGLPVTANGDFAARFFVNDWNSFIAVSAKESVLEWLGAAFDASKARGLASGRGPA